jgi:hypothetical protein
MRLLVYGRGAKARRRACSRNMEPINAVNESLPWTFSNEAKQVILL